MSFMPELRKFLLDNTRIYTVRKYKMGLATVEVSGVGLCKRIPQGMTYKEDLEPFVSDSGFSTLEDWWAKIRHFVPDKTDPLYLYRIELLGEEDGDL